VPQLENQVKIQRFQQDDGSLELIFTPRIKSSINYNGDGTKFRRIECILADDNATRLTQIINILNDDEVQMVETHDYSKMTDVSIVTSYSPQGKLLCSVQYQGGINPIYKNADGKAITDKQSSDILQTNIPNWMSISKTRLTTLSSDKK
jgi:hypothetical protein